MQHATCLNVLLLEFTNMTKMWLFMLLSDCHQTLWLCLTRSMCMRKQIRQKLSCACYSNGLPMHCRHIPLSWNDKPLPRQQSLAVLTPVSSFPPQPVVSWHDWNCAIPVSKHNKFASNNSFPVCSSCWPQNYPLELLLDAVQSSTVDGDIWQ